MTRDEGSGERTGELLRVERESLLLVTGDKEGLGKALLGRSDGGAEGEKVVVQGAGQR
jgi:hypothetical protein